MLSPVPVVGLFLVQGHLEVGGSGLPSSHALAMVPHQARTGSLASPSPYGISPVPKGCSVRSPAAQFLQGQTLAPSASTTWIVSYPAGSF